MGLFSKKKKEDTSGKVVAKPEGKKEIAKKTEAKLKADSKKATIKKDSKKTVSDKVTKSVAKKSSKKSAEAHRFLLKPIISEKATIGAADNKYTFAVSIDANKVAITKAIVEVYGVEPKAVNIINQSGKYVRFGRRFGHTKNIKKAIVTLKKGDSIKLYEGI